MRIPAVAIAVAFSGGILLGRGLHLSHGVLGISFLSIFGLLIVGMLFGWTDRFWAAAIFSLLGWIGLGALGIVVSSRPLAAEHVLRRIATGQIELRTPLRWYGYLRSEPARLAWGIGLEMELSGVETAEGMIPVSGGMRVGFTPKEGEAALPEVHAGDEVSVLALAKLPLVFRDAGAFDRRGNLRGEDNDFVSAVGACCVRGGLSGAPA